MKTTLMTEKELNRRYRFSNALDLSIEKWVRLGLRKNWVKLLESCDGDDEKDYINASTCALCTRHRCINDCDVCSNCPLHEYDCDQCCTQYKKALDAIEEKDRKAFMKARNNLIRRMRRAKKRK